MIKAVYFDLDGTLFDDEQYVRAGLRRAGRTLTDQTDVDLTDELLEAYFERGIKESTFNAVLAEHDLPSELIPTLVDAYHDNDADLDPFPEALEAVETLAERYKLGIITGGRNGREKLRRLGVDDYFDVVLVTPELATTKREAEIFETALDALDVSADDAVYVGDRPELDFPQPNRLGMTTVRVRTGRYMHDEATGDANPDITIESLRELPDVLRDDPRIEDASTGETE